MRYAPAILVAAAVAAFVVGPIVTTLPLRDYFGSGRPFAFVGAVATLLDVNATLPGVFQDNPRPGILFVPLWTIHYELAFALVLACAGALGLLRARRLALACLGVVLAVNVAWFWNGDEHAHLGSPHHLVRFASTFGLGAVTALYAERIPVSNRFLLVLAAATAPLAFSHVAALAGMLLLAYAILCIGFSGGAVAGALGRLGTWSYGFYVWGYLIEQTLASVAPDWSGWAIWAAAFPPALLAGALSWRLIERPAIARTSAVAEAARRALLRISPMRERTTER
jgi:peptidoglycan/LPS O-acetylase OafA/YrhL